MIIKPNNNKQKSNNLVVTKVIMLISMLILLIIIFYFKNINKPSFNLNNLPEYSEQPYIILNNNKPNFNEQEYQSTSFEKYSDLDYLGRAGVAMANIGQDLMPTEERESISSVYPTGFKQAKYDIVSGKYLYNRCHLIGYQLTGENANKQNLITCTKSMNNNGMLPFENKVATYIKEKNKHVLYRVTPFFENSNLLISGVQIEASSVEDRCQDICFNVYVYNVQEGIKINYINGDSELLTN